MGTYCQDRQDKCWSNVDCTGDGRLCQVGVDWSLPANQVRDARYPTPLDRSIA